ncbi:MAG: DUF835 domain-containing protein [Candidatus Thermoplasmatota archaeon]|nr:DUF835 domain-containing protein [Candidatus Thermoplasmatota archaeon]
MAEFPAGTTSETRRGGVDVLPTLVKDLVALGGDGYIRVERRLEDSLPRVGQLVFNKGQPRLAIHEQKLLTQGLDALLEIEDDAIHLDSLISIHQEVDVAQFEEMNPEAILLLEEVDTDPSLNLPTNTERWWNELEINSNTWNLAKTLPDIEPSVDLPENLSRKFSATRKRISLGMQEMIAPGHAYLIDCIEPEKVLSLSSALAELGRPLLVISRLNQERIKNEFQIPEGNCWWLTERNETGTQVLGPSLEGLVRTIDDFLWGNERAVIVLDGLEFLASTNGQERIMSFLNTVVDSVRVNDDVLLMPVDLLAWTTRERHLLTRSTDPLDSSLIQLWLDDIEQLSLHPLCIPIDPDVIAWEKEQLSIALGTVDDETASQIDESNENSENEDLKEQMKEWAIETSTDSLEEHTIENESMSEPDDDWVPSFIDLSAIQSDEIVQHDKLEVLSAEEADDELDEIVTNNAPRSALRIKRKKRQQATEIELSVLKRREMATIVESSKEVSIGDASELNEQVETQIRQAAMNAIGQAVSILPEHEMKTIDQRKVKTLRNKELSAAKTSASDKKITAIEKIKHGQSGNRTAILVGTKRDKMFDARAVSPLKARGVELENLMPDSSVRQKASRSQKNNDPNVVSKRIQEREKAEFEKWRKMTKHGESHPSEK